MKRSAMKRSGLEVSLQQHSLQPNFTCKRTYRKKRPFCLAFFPPTSCVEVVKGDWTFCDTYLRSTTRSHVVAYITGDWRLETSHSISFSFPRFTRATRVTSPFYLFVLFAFVKWIFYKRWILRCVILNTRPNVSNIIQHSRIQHCWTTLHSVERGGQTH